MTTAAIAYEVVLVVDGSPDDTWNVAAELALQYPQFRAIQLTRNYGQHSALLAGIRAARHEVIVTMDDDLQHPPEEIPGLLAALTDELDLVYALPHDEEHGVARNLASRLVKAALCAPLGVQNARAISAFRAFRCFLRDGLENVHGPNASVDIALSWTTARVGVTRVRMDQRATGRSGYTVRRLVRHALNMLFGASVAPLRLVTYLGFLTGLAGLALLGGVLWKYVVGQTTVAGYTTIASMIALFSSAQMVALGILGEYVGRIHSTGMGRPMYVVRSDTGVAGHRVSAPAPAHRRPGVPAGRDAR
jgi:undecaprenyl-phosphate 4-deoxy-4-formamido-L-arabinose transferase